MLTQQPFDTLLQILDYHQFYLALDNEFLADRIKSLVGFLGANWRILGRPILTMIITNSMLGRLMLLRVFSYVIAAVWVVTFELLSPQIKYYFWYNRPFYRYGGHISLIFRLYFRALFGTFFLKVFLE